MSKEYLTNLWCSPDIKVDQVKYVVCIPTFRRPEQLRKTLLSLVAQRSDSLLTVVVAENDASACEGAKVTKEILIQTKLQGGIVVEEIRGNCAAINTAFDTARKLFPNARGFLMIDDDEIADQDWLEMMIKTAETKKADIVGGPVFSSFENKDSPYTKHPAFRSAYDKSGVVPIIYGSGNCLITHKAFKELDNPYFDMQFNFLGGGDTDFFTRCKHLGMHFYWTQNAMITETVPNERTSFSWLAKRSLRTGALNYHIDKKSIKSRKDFIIMFIKNLLVLPVGIIRAGRDLAKHRDIVIAMDPLLRAIGRLLAVIGLEPHQYGS